jgi:muramoyltetrapeptide carboxypeptidase
VVSKARDSQARAQNNASSSPQSKSKFSGDGQHWSPLAPGDIVDLVAPGFPCTEEALENAVRFLVDWGLEPRMPAKIFGRDVLCSNNDEKRLMYLQDALEAPDSKAIWCVRGGYGSIRLAPALMKMKRPKVSPKLFIGLSDITTLHTFLGQKWGWPTVHGPLLDRLGKGTSKPRYVKELKRFVFGEMNEIAFERLKPLNDAARGKGSAKGSRGNVIRGPVSGGNLITLQSTLSTSLHWDTRGRILFFEDIGERGYRVDRVLEHFSQVGLFDQARAVVFGDFTGGAEADGKSLVPAVLKRFAESVRIPVFSGLQSGHDVIQRPLPFETPSELILGEQGTLVCQTGSGR